MKKIGDRDTDVRPDSEIAASVGLTSGATSRFTAAVDPVLRRWTARRCFLLALLVAGQLIAIVGARWTDRLWPVALPWLLSLVAGVALVLPRARVSWRQR